MAGSGIVNELGATLVEVMAFSAAAGAEEVGGGGGALSVGCGGSVWVGAGGGGAGGRLVETVLSPVEVKSGGSTYLLKSTFPPTRTTSRKWINADTVKNRDARTRRMNQSVKDFSFSCMGSDMEE